MEGLCIQRSPWPPARGHAATVSQTPSSGRLYFGFQPGPYYLGASGRTVHHDNLPSPGGLVAVVLVLADANLLKAAPDLFTVAQALTELPALRASSDAEALAARIGLLVEAAHVAVARALGAMQ
ncbi:hypothetical protein [Azohydromonas caseinilytica]|uniref:Uncharacterized protein n=1 Tax=Azohydromonas caseinilytica TaxID=2728836 RepID=A0A848FGI9_9BURK|nr:hypothetical protein [Azohydromonas caseinilytica]NML16981.1 hypothetical protein [Azohydromonas caseinilytica]